LREDGEAEFMVSVLFSLRRIEESGNSAIRAPRIPQLKKRKILLFSQRKSAIKTLEILQLK